MTIFVDASALTAIIAGETDADDLADRLARGRSRFTSPIAIWETVAGLRKSYATTISHGRALVDDFLVSHQFQLAVIDKETADRALDAYQRYGKGRHPAALNMGDCFAYACAKALGGGLLYKGGDFAMTDLA